MTRWKTTAAEVIFIGAAMILSIAIVHTLAVDLMRLIDVINGW